jgi:hypothetical protein
MPDPGQRNDKRGQALRRRLAVEAARLISESGIADYRQARRKAAARLGVSDRRMLPDDAEIELAVREHQRLFRASQPGTLRLKREAAIECMRMLDRFLPRLVADVLDGSAESHSIIRLHVFSDDPEAVPRYLLECGVPLDDGARTLMVTPDRRAVFPCWRFRAGDEPFELTVLPERLLRQPPLNPGSGRPMPSAGLAQVRALLDGSGGDPGEAPSDPC